MTIKLLDGSAMKWRPAIAKSGVLAEIIQRAQALPPGKGFSIPKQKPYWPYQLKRRLGSEYRVGTLEDGTIGILRLPKTATTAKEAK